MPSISVWLIRFALGSLVVGWTIGSLLLASRGIGTGAWIWTFRSLHIELLLFGWMVQLAFGVASWILPRTPRRTGTTPLVLVLILLNSGVWIAGLSTIGSYSIGILAGRVLEVGAVGLFAWYIWPRVRAFRD